MRRLDKDGVAEARHNEFPALMRVPFHCARMRTNTHTHTHASTLVHGVARPRIQGFPVWEGEREGGAGKDSSGTESGLECQLVEEGTMGSADAAHGASTLKSAEPNIDAGAGSKGNVQRLVTRATVPSQRPIPCQANSGRSASQIGIAARVRVCGVANRLRASPALELPTLRQSFI